jgi:Co/Zn/Cd efflux system component
MNTSQLLLISSLGLAVNLFGMFAMGDTTTMYVRHILLVEVC